MKLKLISIEWEILSLEDVKQAMIPTKDWVITVMPNHESLISALNPWVLEIEDKNSLLHKFAIWWWIIETDWKILRIIADMVDSSSELSEEEVKQKLKSAKQLLKDVKNSWKQINPEELLEIEETILKESARIQLLQK